jgi:hypothetical protein
MIPLGHFWFACGSTFMPNLSVQLEVIWLFCQVQHASCPSLQPLRKRAKGSRGAELHPSSWWLVWTSSAGNSHSRREGAGNLPELLPPATSLTFCCWPRPDLLLPVSSFSSSSSIPSMHLNLFIFIMLSVLPVDSMLVWMSICCIYGIIGIGFGMVWWLTGFGHNSAGENLCFSFSRSR